MGTGTSPQGPVRPPPGARMPVRPGVRRCLGPESLLQELLLSERTSWPQAWCPPFLAGLIQTVWDNVFRAPEDQLEKTSCPANFIRARNTRSSLGPHGPLFLIRNRVGRVSLPFLRGSSNSVSLSPVLDDAARSSPHMGHGRRADRGCRHRDGCGDRGNVFPMGRAWLTVCDSWMSEPTSALSVKLTYRGLMRLTGNPREKKSRTYNHLVASHRKIMLKILNS